MIKKRGNNNLYFTIISLLFISMQSCSVDVFKDAKIFERDEIVNDESFYGVNESVTIDNISYKRYILKNNDTIIADGFWSVKNKDTLFFIPYKQFNEGCKNKLIFYIRNRVETNYLGRSCIEGFVHVPTDVIIKYYKDTIINKIEYKKFSHSIVGEDDYAPGQNSIVSERKYLLNIKKGLLFESETNSITEYDIYWFNY